MFESFFYYKQTHIYFLLFKTHQLNAQMLLTNKYNIGEAYNLEKDTGACPREAPFKH